MLRRRRICVGVVGMLGAMFFAGGGYCAGEGVEAAEAERVRGLVEWLKSTDETVRNQATAQLCKEGLVIPDDVIPALIEAFRAERMGMNKSNLAYALSKVGVKAKAAIPDLVACFGDGDRWTGGQMAWAAMTALKAMGEEGVGAVEAALEDDSERVRERAAECLGRMGSKGSVVKLEKTARDAEGRVQLAGALALAQIDVKHVGGVPRLMVLAEDKDVGLRRQSLRALRSLCGDALPALGVAMRCLKDSDETVRAYAAQVIEGLDGKGEKARGPLMEGLRDTAGLVRGHCLRALSRVAGGEAEVRAALVSGLKDEDYFVRACAVTGLAMAQAVEELVGAMGSDRAEVRMFAAREFGEMTGDVEKRVGALTGAMTDKEAIVRSSAAGSLAKIGKEAKGALPALHAAAGDGDEWVRYHVKAALEAIGE